MDPSSYVGIPLVIIFNFFIYEYFGYNAILASRQSFTVGYILRSWPLKFAKHQSICICSQFGVCRHILTICITVAAWCKPFVFPSVTIRQIVSIPPHVLSKFFRAQWPIILVFSRPYLQSRLRYSVLAVCLSIILLSVTYVLYCG